MGSDADSKASVHVDVTRRELAEFDGSFDRSHLLRAADRPPAVIVPKGKEKYNDGLEH